MCGGGVHQVSPRRRVEQTDGTRRRARGANPDVESVLSKELRVTDGATISHKTPNSPPPGPPTTSDNAPAACGDPPANGDAAALESGRHECRPDMRCRGDGPSQARFFGRLPARGEPDG